MKSLTRNIKLYLIIVSLGSALFSCSSSVRFSSDLSAKSATNKSVSVNKSEPAKIGESFTGMASYYGDEFEGRTTACGEIYDGSLLTGAHQTLPFGTKLKVKNLKNGKEIIIVINDRGPFAKGRILDLSKSAAKALDIIRDGVVEVKATVVE